MTDALRRAYIVVDGRRPIRLTKPVVRVGRAPDNDVILSDPRVSRHHLELRWQADHRRFLLIDMGSTGGTRVNGEPVQQCPLEPGDVISLAGVEILYDEGDPNATQRVASAA
ncbi:MAG: FHA domain-containing protein [Anaerolineae bacterium]|nr:FHA domain-containing protein [Thermoflexales bacterium]MDW8394957.1 FHA domain-containing protein [Anaerolineae bacterium]